MPLQSGSDRVLSAMRRSYRAKKFLGIIDRVRDLMPHAAITTDIIVGFPGETDADFAETAAFVEDVGFTKLHVFRYSPRPGTPAAQRADQVPEDVKKDRSSCLRRLGDLRPGLGQRQAAAVEGFIGALDGHDAVAAVAAALEAFAVDAVGRGRVARHGDEGAD